MLSKYVNLSNLTFNVFLIIPHGVGVEACSSLGQQLICWRQSTTTDETLGENVIVRQVPQANQGIMARDDQSLDTKKTDNHSEMKRDVEKRNVPRMAKVYSF